MQRCWRNSSIFRTLLRRVGSVRYLDAPNQELFKRIRNQHVDIDRRRDATKITATSNTSIFARKVSNFEFAGPFSAVPGAQGCCPLLTPCWPRLLPINHVDSTALKRWVSASSGSVPNFPSRIVAFPARLHDFLPRHASHRACCACRVFHTRH